MFRLFASFLALCAFAFAAPSARFGALPIQFEENRGQAGPAVSYVGRAAGLTALVSPGGVTVAAGGHRVAMKLVGADSRARIAPEVKAEGVSNYYIGSRQIVGVPHYARLRAHGVRPGVDLVYYGVDGKIEYDVVLQPGASVADLRFRFDGVTGRPVIAADGDLVLRTAGGEMRNRKPLAWQDTPSGRRIVACRYRVAQSGEVGFVLGKHDPSLAVTIDPVLTYSTFLRGAGGDSAASIAVDSLGNAYIVGTTTSANFPVTLGSRHGGAEVFVTKLNPSGTALIYSTYIGGSADDVGTKIAVDPSGSAFVTGHTDSTDFPVTDGSRAKGRDAFVAKIETNGTLGYSTRIGGTSLDEGRSIVVDSVGSLFITGITHSADFPVTNVAPDKTYGGNQDGFLVIIIPGGVVYLSTFFGGSGQDEPTSLTWSPNGVMIAGQTSSLDFPTTSGAIQSVLKGYSDGFVLTINFAGWQFQYSSYLGGNSQDTVLGVARDSAGALYVTGWTNSSDFPTTPGAFVPSPVNSYYSVFITKITASGALAYSSVISAGYNYTIGNAIAVDAAGSAVVVGNTQSTSFPTTPGALKTTKSNYDSDAFLIKLSPAGDTLSYSTLLGSTGEDRALSVVLDVAGAAYVAGDTSSDLFPTSISAFQTTGGGKGTSFKSAFISKIDLTSPTMCNALLNPPSVNMPGRGGTTSFTMSLPAGCPWEASADSGATITGPTRGMGGGAPVTFDVTVGLNSSIYSTRTLLVRLGSANFTINQAASSCNDPVLTPSSLSFDMSGGIRSLGIMLSYSCNWNIATSAPWLSVTSGQSGSGIGSATIYAAPNSFSARTGTITLAGQSVPVTQAGGTCSASLSPTAAVLPGAGGATSVRLTASAGTCAWSAFSMTPWIQINPSFASGQGSATIPILVGANPGSVSRSGQVLIADQLFTVNQAAGPVGMPASYTPSLFVGAGRGGTLAGPQGLLWSAVNNRLYIADTATVRAVTPDGTMTTFAGGGSGTAENVSPTSIDIGRPTHLALDAAGALYIQGSNRVRKVAGGLISTVAGTGAFGNSGDDGPATAALLGGSGGIAPDSSGTLYVGDSSANRVRKVSGGNIAAFAGGATAFADNVSALLTSLRPADLLYGPGGVLYVSDPLNARIRKITPGATPTISTFAGGGSSSTDGIPANMAYIGGANRLAFDQLGLLLYIDSGRIRRIDTNGVVTTIAQPYNYPSGLAADPQGNIYYSDTYNYVVYKLTPVSSFCSFTLAPPATQGSAGGTATVGVTTAAGCAWSVASDVSWVTSSASGTGTGNATITLAANGGSSRSAVIYVAGQAVTIVQSSGGATMPYRPRDIRGNGRSDVVLYDANAGSAFTGLSNGDGTFNYVASSYYPGYDTLRMGDWNGDGKADLIVYNSITSVAYIGHGDGSGRFNFQSLFWSPGYWKVVLADFNRDGKTDVILCNPDGTTYTGLSNGDGTFRYTYRLVSPGYTHVLTGDFNGDGRPDVFFYRQTDGLAFVGIGDGNANFTFREVPGVNHGNDHVQAGDVNGDGIDDLVLYNSFWGGGRVAISTGNAFTIWLSGWLAGYTSMVLFDYTGDGKVDVFLYNKNTTAGQAGSSLGNAAFGFVPLYWGAGIDYIDVLDLNADGKQDVILYSSLNGFAYSGLNTGNLTSPFTYQYLTWGVGRIVAR